MVWQGRGGGKLGRLDMGMVYGYKGIRVTKQQQQQQQQQANITVMTKYYTTTTITAYTLITTPQSESHLQSREKTSGKSYTKKPHALHPVGRI